MRTLIFTEPDKLYFTSDLHLGHKNIIRYCDRPFDSIQQMDKTIIENWNNTIQDDDTVFILGDVCMDRSRKTWHWYLSQLAGKKILIQGNHDKDKSVPNDVLEEFYYGFININVKDPEIKGNSQRITVCHYPMLSWYQSHRGAWQLFGHMHNSTMKPVKENIEDQEVADFLKKEYVYQNKLRPDQYDVGVDGNKFTPVSYNNIKDIIKNRIDPIV